LYAPRPVDRPRSIYNRHVKKSFAARCARTAKSFLRRRAPIGCALLTGVFSFKYHGRAYFDSRQTDVIKRIRFRPTSPPVCRRKCWKRDDRSAVIIQSSRLDVRTDGRAARKKGSRFPRKNAHVGWLPTRSLVRPPRGAKRF